MSKFDLPIIFKILLNDLSAFKVVPAQLLQGFVNGACGIWYMRNMLRTDSSFKSGGSEIFSSSTPAYFYGVSMGGVLGAGYTLSSPYLARSVLSVPGTPFALLLMRSLDFKSYLKILKIQILRPTHLRLAMSLMQQLWDPGESSGWLGHNASFSGKRFLIQAAEGDAQVSIIGADILARALGAVRFSSPRHKYGIAEVAPAADGYLQEGQARALFTEFYYEGVQPQPQFNLPAAEATDSHELPRRDDRGFRQGTSCRLVAQMDVLGLISQCQQCNLMPCGCERRKHLSRFSISEKTRGADRIRGIRGSEGSVKHCDGEEEYLERV
eukprot:288153-Hanusia_phi.AAC.2